MLRNVPNRQTAVKPFPEFICLFGFARTARSVHISKMTNRLREWRDKSGKSLEDVAYAIGISPGYLSRLERGDRNVSLKYLPSLARELNTSERDLVSLGEDESQESQGVPVVGDAAAGSDSVTFFGDGQGPFEYVEAPTGANDNTVAVRIRGTSMGHLLDGWLAFYDDVRDPPGDSLVGRICVCGLVGGRVVIKKILKHSGHGLYHLASQTEPTMLDVKVEWAAAVREMRPR